MKQIEGVSVMCCIDGPSVKYFPFWHFKNRKFTGGQLEVCMYCVCYILFVPIYSFNYNFIKPKIVVSP